MVARGGIEPPTRGFSARSRRFEELNHQPLAALAGRGTSLTLAHSWHAQFHLDTFLVHRGQAMFFVSEYRFLYSRTVKTTLDIDDELLVRAKAASARERKSLTALIEEGLRLRLRRPRRGSRKTAPRIPIFAGKGGLVAGVNPLSNRSLLDAADDGA